MIRCRDTEPALLTVSPVCGALLVVLAIASPSRGQQASDPEIVFFEQKIRPVLVERCYECHGPNSKRVEANLRLDSRAGMQAGGDQGNVISPEGGGKSLLISAIEYDDLEMPPDGKLPDHVIADFRTWIENGARAPQSFHTSQTPTGGAGSGTGEIDWAAARQHWAFRPPGNVRPPPVDEEAWGSNPIDAFVFDQLQRNGLEPVDPASRHTLVRRLYLNLTGLPPSVEEIRDYVNDTSGGADLRLIDRLLASPHYGERWARHWLDVIRYADSNGADENHPYPYAWRYRNYVIEAFNRDTPFDRFVTEQLAGDLLPPVADHDQTNRRLTATTFLALGIKIDAEKDLEKKRADIIDEQLDTIGRALLGMTIGCARCHDHKFDPIPTSDYYALSGILRSTDLQDRKLGSDEEDAIRRQLAELDSRTADVSKRERQRVLEAARQDPARYIRAARQVNLWRRARLDPQIVARLSPRVIGSRLQPVGEIARREAFFLPAVWLDAEAFVRGAAAIDQAQYGEGIGIVSDRGGGHTWVEYDVELPAEGLYQVEFRYAAAASRTGKLSINGQLVNPQAMGEVTGSWYPDGQRWFVEGRYRFAAGKNVLRFEVEPNMSHLDQLIVVRVDEYPEPVPDDTAGEDDPATIARQNSLDPGALIFWADLLSDVPQEIESSRQEEWVRRLAEEDHRLAGPATAEKYFSGPVGEQLGRLRTQSAGLERQLEQFADRQVMAVADGDIGDAEMFIRGNHRQAGGPVPRRFLTIVSGDQQQAYPDRQSGRLQLAREITAADNPLTSRVIVNRIWRWHFGRGLVESTDNFGMSGDQPTHPELLDFLANYLIEQDWSIKALQRLIVSSRTYRSSSRYSGAQARIDPENRHLWRWQPRRLEAEVIRDSLLKISGRLDPRIGGAATGDVTTSNPSPQNLEENRKVYEDSRRRTVYLPVVRTHVYKFLTLFDFPNPAAPKGNRDSTTVPTQALFLMNSPWVRQLASELADQITANDQATGQQIETVYYRMFGRKPNPAEVAQAREFLAANNGDWAALCHVFSMSNEFLYLK